MRPLLAMAAVISLGQTMAARTCAVVNHLAGTPNSGLTLGPYGVPAGSYLVLPPFGPDSVRNARGWIFTSVVTPATYRAVEAGVPLFGLNVVSVRADMLGATDLPERAALDKYSFVRDGFMQRRAYLLNDGKALPSSEESAERSGDLSAETQFAGRPTFQSLAMKRQRRR